MNSLPNSIFLCSVTEIEVRKTILQLKRKNSCGYDEIPATLLVNCVDEFVPPLTFLVNQSYERGEFPDHLKLAIVKPIFKKGNKWDKSNYRPIALLPVISKVFEKIICQRMYSFLEKFNVIAKNQHGFRKNHSTTTAVFDCCYEIYNALNEHKCAIAVFMDMSKAYDRVCHNILLQKLDLLGMRGKAKNWLTSYLCERKQFVQITHFNETSRELQQFNSPIETVSGSIPQGSVLGCLLFLAYINDLPSVVPHKIVLFADDATMLFLCDYNNISQIHNLITDSLNKVESYLEEIGLILNFEKTKIMQFRPHQRKPLSIRVNQKGKILEEVEKFSFLGITIDQTLSWKHHVEVVVSRLSQFSYALRELRKSTNEHCALTAYHSHAAAWIRYGIVLWGNSTDVKSVLVLQKRCLRIITLTPRRETCRMLFAKFKILTVTSIYIFELCRFVLKNSHYFKRISDMPRNYATRRGNDLVLPISRLALYQSSPYYMAIKTFNHLPKSLKALQGSKFDNELKKLLINKNYYSMKEYFNDKL